jgi:hypothetical protein
VESAEFLLPWRGRNNAYYIILFVQAVVDRAHYGSRLSSIAESAGGYREGRPHTPQAGC